MKKETLLRILFGLVICFDIILFIMTVFDRSLTVIAFILLMISAPFIGYILTGFDKEKVGRVA